MSILHFLLLLLVAGICGSLGKMLAGFSRGGWLVSIGLGFVGALVGTWLAQLAKLPSIFVIDIEGQPFPVAWSILGSALFVAVLGWLWRGRERAA
jgi:uncharacterized membrane protein YeaQ/YmgE (transglycosylase-associated protein family)